MPHRLPSTTCVCGTSALWRSTASHSWNRHSVSVCVSLVWQSIQHWNHYDGFWWPWRVSMCAGMHPRLQCLLCYLGAQSIWYVNLVRIISLHDNHKQTNITNYSCQIHPITCLRQPSVGCETLRLLSLLKLTPVSRFIFYMIHSHARASWSGLVCLSFFTLSRQF